MTISTPQAVLSAAVSYKWHLDDEAPIEQKQSGRRVKINPRSITISANRTWRDGLHVLIEGQTIRQNGTPGQQRRGVVFVDDTKWADDYPISALPAEYHPYLEAARLAEAAR